MIDEGYNEDENICKIKNGMKDPSTTNPTFLNIQELRNEYNADLVGLIVANRKASCGCGSLPRNWDVDTTDQAYFVATFDCATDRLTFAHEIGHAFVSIKAVSL